MGSVSGFLEAERGLFDRYGLEPETHRLELSEPALTARVLECGCGEPLVFVHGGGSSADEWAPLAAALRSRRCLLVDRPGCGGSDPFDYTGVDLRRHAVAFLEATLDRLGLERASLIGNSMGGLWCLWLAVDRPERVRSLTLVGAPGLILGSSAPLVMRLHCVRGLNRLLFRLQPSGPRGVRSFLRMVAGAHAVERMPDEFIEVADRGARVPGAELAWRTVLERVGRLRGGRLSFGEGELRRIQAPTLMIWGDRDAFADPSYGREACAMIPEARLELVNGGHLPWWDDPGRCAELASRFLASIDADTESRRRARTSRSPRVLASRWEEPASGRWGR